MAVPLQGAGGDEGGVVFCSYNLKNYLKMRRFVGGQRREDVGKPEREIAAVVRFLVDINADILGVSEIGTKEDLADLQRRLKELGVDYPYLEHAHGGDPVRCLGLLSKLPIVARDSQRQLVYRLGNQTLPMQRGILDATVQVTEDKRLRCLGVHFKSKRAVAEADEALMRRNEARLLRGYVDGILQADESTLLLVHGDFNEHAHETPIREVEGRHRKETALRSVKVVDSRGQSWTQYWVAADVYSRFDYVFVNGALSRRVDRRNSYVYEVADFLAGSDHRPVVVRLRFEKN